MLKHTEDQLVFAKEMAEDFIKLRGLDLSEEFFEKSGLLGHGVTEYSRAEPEVMKLLQADYGEAVRRYLALAYGMGMIDGFQNHVEASKGRLKPKLKAVDPNQPTLPGFEE